MLHRDVVRMRYIMGSVQDNAITVDTQHLLTLHMTEHVHMLISYDMTGLSQ